MQLWRIMATLIHELSRSERDPSQATLHELQSDLQDRLMNWYIDTEGVPPP